MFQEQQRLIEQANQNRNSFVPNQNNRPSQVGIFHFPAPGGQSTRPTQPMMPSPFTGQTQEPAGGFNSSAKEPAKSFIKSRG